MRASLFLIVLIGWLAAPARAWDKHVYLTKAALENVSGLDAPVQAETLNSYLQAVGGGDVAGFLAVNLMNPTITLPFELGEKPGSFLPLRDVIAGYSNEPDGGMDQDLFSFYPQLWQLDYEFMIGKNGGFQTRVFRHSYWPFGYLKPSAAPGGQPVHVATSLGEAPERAQLFFDQSRKAFAAGHPYWGGRFLAWGLHYLEDVTQPFHATQVPSLAFLQFKPTGELDIEATVRTVAYYHLIMDSYPSQAAQGSLGPDARRAVEIAESSGPAAAFTSARRLTEDAATAAAHRALKTADAMLDFFPDPTPADLADPLKRAYDPALWRDVTASAKADPAHAAAYQRVLSGLLSASGADIRAMTLQAVSAAAAASLAVHHASAPAPLLARAQSLASRLLGPLRP